MAAVGPRPCPQGGPRSAQPQRERLVKPEPANQPPAQLRPLLGQAQGQRHAVQAGERGAQKGVPLPCRRPRDLEQPAAIRLLQPAGGRRWERGLSRQSQHINPTFPDRCRGGSRSACSRRWWRSNHSPAGSRGGPWPAGYSSPAAAGAGTPAGRPCGGARER